MNQGLHNVKPKIVRTVEGLRRETGNWRAKDYSFAIVPTMGALHEGHLQLVKEGLKLADRVIVSIFINPRQFAEGEDLSRYPRDEEGDLAKLSKAGAHLIYAPGMDQIYSANFSTTISLGGPAKANLEDKFRPQFFDGVATIVAKLFIQSSADYAMFGEKDYQQLQVVKFLAKDLDMPIEVVGVPTVRDPDGLALSSRNQYLSKVERQHATAIYKSLTQAADKIHQGVDIQTATRAAARSLTTLGFRVDYVTARNAETLAVPSSNNDKPLRLFAAAWLGTTRLIDNIEV